MHEQVINGSEELLTCKHVHEDAVYFNISRDLVGLVVSPSSSYNHSFHMFIGKIQYKAQNKVQI